MEAAFAAITELLGTLEPNDAVTGAIVAAAWPKVAGEMIDERTEVLGFAAGRLTIGVRDATWKRQLEHLAPQLVAKLNGKLGDDTVKFIDFRSGSPKLRVVNKTKANPSDLPPAVQRAAMQIADTDLRQSFTEAAAAYLSAKE